MASKAVKIEAKKLNIWFGKNHVIKDLNLSVSKNSVTAIMGPSGCGKSTLIRSINRMNEIIEGCITKGEVLIDNMNIYDPKVDTVELRRRVGMVFQKPNPFPKNIFENIAYGPKVHGIADKNELKNIVESSLKRAALLDEVEDRLKDSALKLSGGQQQRLCIARALAVGPEVILMDEPCSALDPVATAKIEALIRELSKNYTVIIVTHNMQQAARVSDFTAFLYMGNIIEYGKTKKIFQNPDNELTENYITGRFG
ncbi:MAG: phosphate ABC transporter ATP-binding protein PstB [Candidatus Bathyarchaeota archaeon]|nr:phosphate ABC transporter ATP-binding protein PstB [Candidatus Bathyarchaeota archaeon]